VQFSIEEVRQELTNALLVFIIEGLRSKVV